MVTETPLEHAKIIQKCPLCLGIEDADYIVLYRLLVCRVGIDPARMHLGFPQDL